MNEVGSVAELWRYPVKSMGGERIEAARLTDMAAIEGDRVFAVMDVESGKVLSAKRVPRLLEASAAYLTDDREARDAGRVAIDIGGRQVTSEDPAVDRVLSEWLERPVRLIAPETATSYTFEIEVDLDDEGVVADLHTQPGRFHDSRSTLHLLSLASLAAAAEFAPDAGWDIRRFRPNVVVASTAPGFAEDEWVGAIVRIGDRVVARVRKRTGRCILTTRAQPGLARDLDVLLALADHHGGDLGVYLDPDLAAADHTPAALSVGAAITLERP